MCRLRSSGVLAVALVALLPGVGATVPASASYAEPIGTPVEGGVSARQATPLTSGTYVSAIPSRGRDAYFTIPRQQEGSRIWYAGSIFPTPGTDPVVGFEASAGDTGEICTDYTTMFLSGSDLPLLGLVGGSQVHDDCAAADEIVIRVGSDDVPEDSRFQIVVWEEPAPTNADELPPGSISVAWDDEMPTGEPKAVEAGTDWQTAPALTDGTYSTTAGNGEVGLFRVKLEYGEHLQVSATSSTEATEEYASAGIALFSPFGGGLDDNLEVEGGSSGDVPLGDPATPGRAVTQTIGRNNEVDDDYHAAAAMPGDYYFAFDATGEDFPDTVDFDFSVKVVEDFEVPAPTYAEGVDVAPIPSLSTAPAADQGSTDEAASSMEPDERPMPAILVLTGLAIIATAGGFGALGRARRGVGRHRGASR